MMVGIIIGAWIGGGVVATMVYYGLKLITPSLFLVAIATICIIVSLSIGSSWSTMGTRKFCNLSLRSQQYQHFL